jgi:thiol-disulfide isomerase/thioredoxin
MKLFNKPLIVLLFIAASCSDSKRKESRSISSSQTEIEKVKLTSLKGMAIDMKQYNGKVVFINFWATWCKPCREEMPSIQEAMKVLKNEKIEFFFASDETTEQIEEFKAGHEYSFNYVKVESLSELNIMGLPTTFIFDPNGELVFSEMGYRKWDDRANIDLLLKIAKPE